MSSATYSNATLSLDLLFLLLFPSDNFLRIQRFGQIFCLKYSEQKKILLEVLQNNGHNKACSNQIWQYLLIEAIIYKVTMHVSFKQISANQTGQIKPFKIFLCYEFVVFIYNGFCIFFHLFLKSQQMFAV
jgi:hypothetical protein